MTCISGHIDAAALLIHHYAASIICSSFASTNGFSLSLSRYWSLSCICSFVFYDCCIMVAHSIVLIVSLFPSCFA